MKVSNELLDWEVNQGAMDALLDTAAYTSQLEAEGVAGVTGVAGVADVPGVHRMARVLFKVDWSVVQGNPSIRGVCIEKDLADALL